MNVSKTINNIFYELITTNQFSSRKKQIEVNKINKSILIEKLILMDNNKKGTQ